MFANLVGLAILLCAITAAAAEPAAMSPIHQYVRGFDSGDTKIAIAAFSDDAVIIDEDPPRVWRGPHAAARWVSDVLKNWASLGVADMRSQIGTPTEADINNQDAYIVVPEALDYKVRGAAMCLRGDHVFVLRKRAGDWKIAASALATQVNTPGLCAAP